MPLWSQVMVSMQKLSTITSDLDSFMFWRAIDGEKRIRTFFSAIASYAVWNDE